MWLFLAHLGLWMGIISTRSGLTGNWKSRRLFLLFSGSIIIAERSFLCLTYWLQAFDGIRISNVSELLAWRKNPFGYQCETLGDYRLGKPNIRAQSVMYRGSGAHHVEDGDRRDFVCYFIRAWGHNDPQQPHQLQRQHRIRDRHQPSSGCARRLRHDGSPETVSASSMTQNVARTRTRLPG